MDEWRAKYEALRKKWDDFDLKIRIAVIAGVAVLATGGIIYAAMGTGPSMSMLMSGLAPDESVRITELLTRMNVQFEVRDGGATIMVPEDDVHQARLTIASDGGPAQDGWNIVSEAPFGQSNTMESARLHRALEGELARTISAISGVESTRVHLVLEDRNLFTTDDSPASASVAIKLQPGWQLQDTQVQGIVSLVARSVRGLEPDNITIVDQQGRNLTGLGSNDPAGDAISYRMREEQTRQESIQRLLDNTIGAGKARVSVAADVDFTREEITEERYDPESSVTRNEQIAEVLDPDAARGARGVAGAQSNLGGGNQATGGDEGVRSREHTRNVAVGREVRRAEVLAPRVTRMTVAVMVDGHWQGEGEDRLFTPLPDEDLDRIRDIVSGASGVNLDRGDTVTVRCVPFAASETPMPDMVVDPLADVRPYFPYLAYGIGLLVSIFLLVKVALWNRRRKKQLAEEAERNAPPELTAPTSVRELERSMMQAQAPSASLAEDFEEEEEDPTAAEIRNLAAKLATDDPERAARVIRGWLLADSQNDSAQEAGSLNA